MGKTKIEWADKVWNPVVGCTKVSQGCKNCYAERIYERFHPGSKFTDVQIHPEKLEEPLHWQEPAMVFVNSMSDLFHEKVYEMESSFLNEVFAIMAATPRHTYLVLTKRPVIMRNFISEKRRDLYIEHSLETIYGEHGWCPPDFQWPLPNVWMGVSVEDQKTADERIPLLLETPAAKRFISVEPMLKKIDLFIHFHHIDEGKGFDYNPGLHWVICGGESGPGARPMHPDWARSLRDQCKEANIPFFFKQWGEWLPDDQLDPNNHRDPMFETDMTWVRVGKKVAGRVLDGRIWKEFPL